VLGVGCRQRTVTLRTSYDATNFLFRAGKVSKDRHYCFSRIRAASGWVVLESKRIFKYFVVIADFLSQSSSDDFR
jgi:hypothetical protein